MTLQSPDNAPTCRSITVGGLPLAYKLLVATTIAAISGTLFFRLPSFPGLHGDEAWVGLRALEQHAKGFFTIRGMNAYTGSLFPQIVTLASSLLSPGVLSLRLPGVLLNWLALVLMAAALWKRGSAALSFLLLMGSSLLFLFYSRVAWEVNALQNFLLSLIILSLTILLKSERPPLWTVFLLFLAFSLGTWNHEIFVAATLSFAAAATLVALKWPDEDSARLLSLGYFNLVLQIVLLGKRFVADGPFVLHALPALIFGCALVALSSLAYVRAEKYLLPAISGMIRSPPVVHAGNGVVALAIAGSLLISVTSASAFFGTLSGIIMLKRVVSYSPGFIEVAGLHARMALLVAAFLAIAARQMRNVGVLRRDQLLNISVMWTIAFFPALMLATRSAADRYYIIPQFLFFCSIALAVDHVPDRWRSASQAFFICGFIYAQAMAAREVLRDDNRPPFETFEYGSYADTSRHFLRLDRLSDYLQRQDVCHVESSSFFIAQPAQFLMATHPTCGNPHPENLATVGIEYCSGCGGPVAWFELTPGRVTLKTP